MASRIVRVEMTRKVAPAWASTARTGERYVRTLREARRVREQHSSWLGLAVVVVRADGTRSVEVV